MGVWRVSFANPPINLFTPASILEFQPLVTAADQDPTVKMLVLVLVFESSDPDFFIAHFDASTGADAVRTQAPDGRGAWLNVVRRLSAIMAQTHPTT